MLKLIIIPAFILTCLAIYAAVEEAMEWKYGKRKTPESVDDFKQWCEDVHLEWVACNIRAEDFYDRPWNRLRLWLANIIAP